MAFPTRSLTREGGFLMEPRKEKNEPKAPQIRKEGPRPKLQIFKLGARVRAGAPCHPDGAPGARAPRAGSTARGAPAGGPPRHAPDGRTTAGLSRATTAPRLRAG